MGGFDKQSNSGALTYPLAAAGAKKHSSPVLLDNNTYHSMAVKSTKLLTSQSHAVLQYNCSLSLNVPLNCNTPYPLTPPATVLLPLAACREAFTPPTGAWH